MKNISGFLSQKFIAYVCSIMALKNKYSQHPFEAGVDEAGRGCIAGPVVAAAVILPPDFTHPVLKDSKKLSHKQRMEIRPVILEEAIAWNVGMISAPRIDQVNILNATYEAMHEAIAGLSIKPDFLVIDGNRFRPYPDIEDECIIKGDGKYLNIAAASILAKTYRDEIMEMLAKEFPSYDWESNKGYPTPAHKQAVLRHGTTKYHRKTFNLYPTLTLF